MKTKQHSSKVKFVNIVQISVNNVLKQNASYNLLDHTSIAVAHKIQKSTTNLLQCIIYVSGITFNKNILK